jgi:hypothetical protein
MGEIRVINMLFLGRSLRRGEATGNYEQGDPSLNPPRNIIQTLQGTQELAGGVGGGCIEINDEFTRLT